MLHQSTVNQNRKTIMTNRSKSILTYNVIIIEENQTEIILLQKIISEYCLNLNIIGCAESIEEGIIALKYQKPDIVFMNVKFQNSIIFDHLHKFDIKDVQLIFISSSAEYAVNAFNVDAADFIMKPLSIETVLLSIRKVIKKIKFDESYLDSLFTDLIMNDSQSNHNFITVSSLEKVDFLKKEDIVYCASDGKYTTFYLTNGKNIVSSKNIGVYEKLLENSFFYRIHHSYIINIKHLLKINKRDGCFCELQNNIFLPISKRKQEDFFKILKIKVS